MADLSTTAGWPGGWTNDRTWDDAAPTHPMTIEGDTMTIITLTKPIANGPELIGTLTLRQPRLGDSPILMRAYAAFSAGDVGSLADNLLDVLAAITSQPRAVVDQIDPADLGAVLDGLSKHIDAYTQR